MSAVTNASPDRQDKPVADSAPADRTPRIETYAWIAAFCLLTVGPGGLSYSLCVLASEIIILTVFVRSTVLSRSAPNSAVGRLAALWLCSEVVSTVWSYITHYGTRSPYAAQLYSGGFYGPLHLLIDTAVGIAGFFAIRSRTCDGQPQSMLRRAAPVLIAAGGVAMLCSIEQARNMIVGTDDPRIQGTFTNPNLLAAFFCLTLPLAVGAALSPELPQRGAARIALATLAAFLTAGLALTDSRGAILGCTVALTYFAAALWSQRPHNAFDRARRGQLAVKLMAGACAVIAIIGVVVLPHLMHSSRSISDGQRLVAWRAAILMIDSKPILGIGVNGFPAAMEVLRLKEPDPDSPTGLPMIPAVHLHAHDLLLQAWVERGLLGAGCVILLIALVLRKAVRNVTEINSKADAPHPIVLGAAASVLATLTQNVTDYTLWYAPIVILAWYVLGLMFSSPVTIIRRRENHINRADN